MDKSCEQITPRVLKVAVSKEHGFPPEAISIEDIVIKEGSKMGEGFACEIAAVQFTAKFGDQQLTKNYIAKFTPQGPSGSYVREIKLFSKEVQVYTFLLPKCENLRASKGLKPLPFPKCFYASEEEELLIMENLKLQKFVVIQKKPEPLNIDAIKEALKSLAAFHASARTFVETYPGGKKALADDFQKMFQADFFDPTSAAINKIPDMIDQMIGTSLSIIQKFGSKDLANRMLVFKENAAERVRVLLSSSSKLNIMMHGDAWYNNFMFRFSSESREELVDLRVIDMQTTRIGRSGIELSYFFCSSTSPQQRKQHFEELLRYYYDCFFSELVLLGEIGEPYFTFEELMTEYNECYVFGFSMGLLHAQGLLYTGDGTAKFDLEAFNNEEELAGMIEALKVQVLESVGSNPDFLNIFLGLAQEAAEKKLI